MTISFFRFENLSSGKGGFILIKKVSYDSLLMMESSTKERKMEKYTPDSMAVKAIVSSKGQLVIPKILRDSLGIHSGTEVFLTFKKNGTLELSPVKRSIQQFFGRCKEENPDLEYDENLSSADLCLMQAVLQNDKNTLD